MRARLNTIVTRLRFRGHHDLALVLQAAVEHTQYLALLRQAKALVKEMSRSDDVGAMLKHYQQIATWFRPLSKMLEPLPKLERADEQRKLQTVIGFMRRIDRMTDAHYLEKRAIGGDVDAYTISLAAEELVDAAAKVLKYWDRIAGYTNVEKEFKHGPFVLENRYGYTSEECTGVFKMLDEVGGVVTRAGFKHLLYGTIHLGGRVGQHSGAANYNPGRDDITIDVDKAHSISHAGSLVHELGHREWFVFLDEQERTAYEDAWSASAPNAIDIETRDRYWEAWKGSGYDLKRAVRLIPQEDQHRFRAYVLERRKVVDIVPREGSMDEQMVARQFIMPKQRFYYLGGQPDSVTRYGTTNVREDFAEVFAHHVLGMKLADDARERLAAAVKRKVKL